MTTLRVTHDQTEALTLGDRVGMMRDGTLLQVASPDELCRGPRNLFVRFGDHRIGVDGPAGDHRWPGLRRYAGPGRLYAFDPRTGDIIEH